MYLFRISFGGNMLQHKDHFHGSDLELIEKEYGIKKDEIISEV